MTVLVTGGNGLVGSHVIEALRARGDAVRALVRDAGGRASRGAAARLGAEVVVGDVTDPDAWRRASDGVDGIVHAAALVAQRATLQEYLRVNVEGTRLAARAARAVGARLVHISSVAVYGRPARAAPAPVTEELSFQPLAEQDFYARSKRMAEEVLREEVLRGGLAAAAVRPNVVYGERDRLFTPRVVALVRRGILPLVGPGTNHLSCVYAGNVAAAVVAALHAPPRAAGFRAYNTTRDAPPALTQREYLAAFATAFGVRPVLLPVPIPLARLGAAAWSAGLRLVRPFRYAGLGRSAVAFATGENPFAADRAVTELGWQPPYSTRDAIARTARWFLRDS